MSSHTYGIIILNIMHFDRWKNDVLIQKQFFFMSGFIYEKFLNIKVFENKNVESRKNHSQSSKQITRLNNSCRQMNTAQTRVVRCPLQKLCFLDSTQGNWISLPCALHKISGAKNQISWKVDRWQTSHLKTESKYRNGHLNVDKAKGASI